MSVNISVGLLYFSKVCPVCAALPGGDPNHVTDDFAAHLTLEHRAPSRPDMLISFTFQLKCIYLYSGTKLNCVHDGLLTTGPFLLLLSWKRVIEFL